MHTPIKFIVAELALDALASVVVVATATATAPGKNGSIAFRRYFDPDQTRGCT